MDYPSTAVILSGGAGSRLRPLTNDIPKGLVKVANKPLLQWVVEWLRVSGVTELVIGVAYLREKITRYFGNGSRFGVSIRYSVHSVEGGTGEGFRLAVGRYVDDDCFFALNGDQITDLDLKAMFRLHSKGDPLATLAVVHPRLPFGLVLADRNGYCTGFQEKPLMKSTYVSSGVYVFQRSILDHLPITGDVEKTTFPELAKNRKLKAYIHKGSFTTVNSLRELEEADREMQRATRK